MLIQRYDEILADPVNAVRELAHHVGIEPADGEAERIAHEYSLASNKARAEALRRRLEQSGVDVNEAANAQICDSTTLLHWNHVRDGGSGSWFVESNAAPAGHPRAAVRPMAEGCTAIPSCRRERVRTRRRCPGSRSGNACAWRPTS